MKLFKHLAFSFIIFLSAINLSAQKQTKGWTWENLNSKLGFGLNQSKGNTKNLGLNCNLAVTKKDSISELSLNSVFIYGENKEVVTQNEFTVGVQFDYLPFAPLSPFVRAELYINEFKNIESRSSFLIGGKFKYFNPNEHTEYSLSGSIQFDSERQMGSLNEHLSPETIRKLRWSFRPKFKQRIAQNIYLLQEIYYKPSIGDFDDYLVQSLTSIQFKVNKHVQLSFKYDYDYDNHPRSDLVFRTNSKTSTVLLFNF